MKPELSYSDIKMLLECDGEIFEKDEKGFCQLSDKDRGIFDYDREELLKVDSFLTYGINIYNNEITHASKHIILEKIIDKHDNLILITKIEPIKE